jgi:hypothetical protein
LIKATQVQQDIDEYLTRQSKPHLAPTILNAKITVSNTGDVAADHVVLLFAKPPAEVTVSAGEDAAGAPIQQLAAFNRLAAVQPGESRTVELPITAQHLAFASRDGSWVTAEGKWALQVGPQQLALPIL